MEAQVVISIFCTIAGMIIGYFTFTRNREKDLKQDVKREATETAIITTKLDNIGQGVDSIRVKMEVHEMRFGEIAERVTRVEESSKQAHKRLDNLKGGD